MNYSLNLEKLVKIKALFDQSLNEYLQWKMNSLLCSDFQYSVTIRINLIWIKQIVWDRRNIAVT